MTFKFLFLGALVVILPTLSMAQTPDYLSLGVGGYDFDKHPASRQTMDYRVEYRWGWSVVPHLIPRAAYLDHYVQFHPTVGFEMNGRKATYGNAGWDMDVAFLRHGIFTWGETVGYFGHGDDPRTLGGPIQFRSQIELGWQFNNNVRLTGYLSHISNARLRRDDPGAEIAGAYLHLPMQWMHKP